MTAITVERLELRRAGFTLGPLDLSLPSGSATALIGPSGAGKTTLLRCLAGLEQPAAGRIAFGQDEVSGPGRRVPPAQRRIGFVFQSGALWPHLTADQHLRFVAPRAGAAARAELLASVGLGALAERRPAELSAGEAQRLALARALAGEPRILLLDEPLGSVDPHRRDELALLVRRLALARALTTIVVTHDRDEALAMADGLVVLCEGAVVESGPAPRLLEAPRTAYAAAFLGRAARLPAKLGAGDTLVTALGVFPRPPGAKGSLELVLLPGDVEADGKAAGLPEAPVVRIEPWPQGRLAVVELCGQSVRVRCHGTPAIGEALALRLPGAPRLLPAGTRSEAP